MKQKIRTPFFEVGVKNYIYGDAVVEMGRHLDELSEKYDVDVLYIVPTVDIRAVAQSTKRLIVFAPYMDAIRPGRGMGLVLPESLKAAGAKGVLMNHCERPMTLAAIRQTIERADELELLSFACADSVDEGKAVAQLHPDIISPEPNELIGSGTASGLGYVKEAVAAIRGVDPNILVEQSAGITRGEQVYRFIMAGSHGAGAGSGIFTAADPCAKAEELVAAVRDARLALEKHEKKREKGQCK